MRRNSREEFKIRTDNYPFIYKTCLAPMLRDLAQTWVLYVMSTIISNRITDPNYYFNQEMLIGSDRAYFINSSINAAVDEIIKSVDKCAEGKMYPLILLDSLKVNPQQTLLDTINSVKDDHFIAEGGQNTWLCFLKDYQYLKIVKDVFSLQPDLISTKMFFRQMDLIGRRYANTRFWSHIKNPIVKNNVEERFIDLFDIRL